MVRLDGQYYKSKRVADLYGISQDTLYYYESKGLIAPRRDPVNNYRMYGPKEIHRLNIIRELLELDFPVDQITTFFEKKNIGSTMGIFNSERKRLDDRITKLLRQKQSIDARISMYSEAITKAQNELVEFTYELERQCILISGNEVDYKLIDRAIVEYMSEHGMPIVMTGMADCYAVDVDKINEYNCFGAKSVFLYSPSENYKSNYELPAGTYAECTYRGFVWKTTEKLPDMLEEIIARGYDTCGDPIEMCIIDEYESDDEDEYVTRLEIPVNMKPKYSGSPHAKDLLERANRTRELIRANQGNDPTAKRMQT